MFLEGFISIFSECATDVMCNRFSADGSLLAVGLINGSVKVSYSWFQPFKFMLMSNYLFKDKFEVITNCLRVPY